LTYEDAAILAAKTAAIRQAAVEGATMKQSLIKGGMQPEKAKRMADAHVRWHPSKPNIIVREPEPPTVRVEGFQSMGDIFGPIQAKAQAAMKAQPAPPEAAKKPPPRQYLSQKSPPRPAKRPGAAPNATNSVRRARWFPCRQSSTTETARYRSACAS
jgi:hypothetical protein